MGSASLPGLRLVAAAACGVVLGGPRPALAAPASPCPPRSEARAAADARFAAGRYALEATGTAVGAALARVEADRVLTDALRAGNLRAANAAALGEVRGHHHITAIRVLQAGRVVVATVLYPFDVAGARARLRDRHGASVGTVEVSIQDLIGFIRLVHKFTGSQVVVRGAAGNAKSSLPAALTARLPSSGCATVAGRAYAVRSLTETAFDGEALRIWLLRAP